MLDLNFFAYFVITVRVCIKVSIHLKLKKSGIFEVATSDSQSHRVCVEGVEGGLSE